MTLLRLEWQKIFSRQSAKYLGLLVIFLSAIYLKVLMNPEEVVIENHKEAALEIVRQFEGPFNLDNHHKFKIFGHEYSVAKKKIKEQQELLYSGKISKERFHMETLAPKKFLETESVYNSLLKNVIYLMSDSNLERQLIYPNGWHYIFNSHKIYYPLLFLLQWLGTSIMLGEREGQMKPIIRSTISGREKVTDAKLKVILIYTIGFVGLIFVMRFAIASLHYGIDHYEAPASSLARFMSMPSSMKLVHLLLLTLIMQVIAYISYVLMLACVAESSASAALSFFSGLAIILLGIWQRGRIGLLTYILPTTLMDMWVFEIPANPPGYLATIGHSILAQFLLICGMTIYLRRRYRSDYRFLKKHKLSLSSLAICLILLSLSCTMIACRTEDSNDHHRYMSKGFISYRGRLIIPFQTELKYNTLTEFEVCGNPPNILQTDLIRDPFATGSQRTLEHHFSVEDNKAYYQVHHLKEIFDADFYVYALKEVAIEIRELDLDTYEDKSYLYLQLDERFREIISGQSGLYVSSGRVYIILNNSVHELTQWGIKEKVTIPEMKRIDLIHNDLIYGPNYTNNLLVFDLNKGELSSYDEVFLRGSIYISDEDIIFQDDISGDVLIQNLNTGTARVILRSKDHPRLTLADLYRGRILFSQESQKKLRVDYYSCDLNGERIVFIAGEKDPMKDSAYPVGSGYFIGGLYGASDVPEFYDDPMLEED